MSKYLITGGSGFIGTNLISILIQQADVTIVNLDIAPPKVDAQKAIWKQVDILDNNKLKSIIVEFQPDYVIHLAARTDLHGEKIKDYDANTQGVNNMLDILGQISNIKRVIFASSMYVCEPGYIPKDFEDYAPHTLYGESKVIMEKNIKKRNPQYTWSIIRPTSIWGPWFGEPYKDFFLIIIKRSFFHMGSHACMKTYGYVDNTIYQIISLLKAKNEDVNRRFFYLGDYQPYNIEEWANEIANCVNVHIPQIPFFLFKLAGWLGDILKLFKVKFPMSSFRLHNMTTNNIHNLELIQKIAPNLPTTRIQGTKKTINWMLYLEK